MPRMHASDSLHPVGHVTECSEMTKSTFEYHLAPKIGRTNLNYLGMCMWGGVWILYNTTPQMELSCVYMCVSFFLVLRDIHRCWATLGSRAGARCS